MTGNSYFFLFVGFVLCVVIVLAIVTVRGSWVEAASGIVVTPDQRSPLWALTLIATIPIASYINLLGGGILSLLLGRCSLWGCSPSRPLAELEFSPRTIAFGLALCAVIFGIWWLALLPNPLPRNPVVRRAIWLVIAFIGTLLAVVYAVFGVD